MQTVWLPILKVPAEQRTGGLEMTAKSKLGDNGEEDAATSSPNPLHALKGYASRGISKKADV